MRFEIHYSECENVYVLAKHEGNWNTVRMEFDSTVSPIELLGEVECLANGKNYCLIMDSKVSRLIYNFLKEFSGFEDEKDVDICEDSDKSHLENINNSLKRKYIKIENNFISSDQFDDFYFSFENKIEEIKIYISFEDHLRNKIITFKTDKKINYKASLISDAVKGHFIDFLAGRFDCDFHFEKLPYTKYVFDFDKVCKKVIDCFNKEGVVFYKGMDGLKEKE